MSEIKMGEEQLAMMEELGKYMNLKLPPPAHKDLQASFLEHIPGRMISKTKSNIIMHAEAYKGDNILVATCTSRMLIMKPKS